MAELYEKPKLYANAPAGSAPISGDPDIDKMLAEIPPEEREEAMRIITAPPTGEEIANAMQEKNANGEVMNLSLEQYRLLKAHNKNKEVDIISTFGQAAGHIFEEIQNAAGSVVNNPSDALGKLTPSLIEAFSQGTRNLYGMAAQSADPNSVMFRMKHALTANGSDEEAEYNQFMEAQQFNVHSMNLASGKETLLMDKDAINHEMTQVMSYVADPTLFIPFGGIAAKGARLIGMGEGLAKASARAAVIRNKVLGGAIKWGAGVPIEFLGTATRNTIDYGLERSASAFEFATGMPAAEAQATARQFGLNSVSASLAGETVPLPIVGNIAGAAVGATTARGVGEALTLLGEQISKQAPNGRGILSYAGQALRDSEKAGVKLSAHAKGLLKVIDLADPLFVYGSDLAEGAIHGSAIGAGLGYLSGGEEGAASGAGAGFALGSIGAGLGSITADVTNNRLYDRVAIQRKMVIEGLKGTDDAKASALEAYVKSAESTGDRRYMAEVDGMIAGIDMMSPNSKWNIRTEAEHTAWLKSLKIDPKTGRLEETTAILPQFGADRKQRASALSFLSMVSDNFSGLPENLKQHIDTLPADHAMKKHWNRLSDDVKAAVLAEVKQSGDVEYRKAFGGKKSNQYYGDINYAEAHTARINSLFDSGNITAARERINMLIKEETIGGKLTERGKALKDKLATEGYFDKDGALRPSRLKDVEMTSDTYRNVAGFVLRRDSTGQVEINLNLDQMGKVTGLHELFHAIMLDSPMKDEFIKRLSTKLLGSFDANGKRIEGASVDTGQVKKFFQRYIDSLHRNDPKERANETTRLERAIEEYEQRGDQNKVNRTTSTTLEDLVEEFGAFYFPKFIQDKPVDYLFRGGELGNMREMFQSVKFGWLDFWRDKVGSRNPELDFDSVQGFKLSHAFGKDGQPRYKNKALDLFMGDFVKATAMANRNGQFDVSRLSNEGQKTFIKNNGIRGYGIIDKDGKVVRVNRRTALKEEMRVGKEIYKIVAGLDPKYRQGLTLDGEGNFSGRISPELAEELVKSGHVERAWVDKLLRAYDIIDGKGSNVIEFGYLGRTAQIGDYAWPRLVGSDVPFKNRKAILLDVDFKIGADGRMTALYHTLDHAVIESRANVLWSDPSIRMLWDGDRGSMEADFFRYLSNASLPSDHPNRVSSAKLLEDGTGKGAMRRNALHQMLGMAKLDGDVYINKPIAEIPLGIRHSVTTFNVDGVSGMRVRQGARYDYNHQNAFRDLSRNFMMSEMASEETPNGKILKHGTGYKITKMAGSNRFSVFDKEGKELGRFDTLADAGRAAQKDYNARFDAKVEGKDLPVPRTEIPPSRQAYIERGIDISKNEDIKKGLLKFFEERAKSDFGGDMSVYAKDIAELNSNGVTENILKDWRFQHIEINGRRSKVINFVEDYKSEIANIRGAEYDKMYPMEIKSALHGRLAQIMQDYPNLTAQGLLKKLDVYGSQGYRYLQEAKEIGLVDLLESKIKPRTEIYRKLDAQGNPTGEVVTREIPIERRHTGEVVGGTQPVLDMQEILDFAKSKEIKVTIEEGAREVNGMDTESLTLGGDKSNYKQTAIRINPEYAHGIRGHYGENTIVHFRTTERLDAEGNKVLFIEEVQANNTDDTKIVSEVAMKRMKSDLETLKQYKQDAIAAGVFTEDYSPTGNKIYVNERENWFKEWGYSEAHNIIQEAVRKEITGTGYDYAITRDTLVREIMDNIDDAVNQPHLKNGEEFFDRVSDLLISNYSTDRHYRIFKEFSKTEGGKEFIKSIGRRFERDYKFFEDKGAALLNRDLHEAPYNAMSIMSHERIREHISDLSTSIAQTKAKGQSHPLTQAKDWTLTALKGIIRQAIRDGLDTITLTHPDDSPTVSNMKEKARRGLYGKTIPEVWGSWLRKYGIEIVQQNRLADANIDFHKNAMAEISSKLAESNQKVLDKFKQIGSFENPDFISYISTVLATPVHEIKPHELGKARSRIIREARDVEFGNLLEETLALKSAESAKYSAIQQIREEGLRSRPVTTEDIKNNLRQSSGAAVSAEAIDRGMTFKLNDAIKQDFLSGNVKTHAMPTEGEGLYQGGRTYNQNSKKWKSGFIGLWADENKDKLKGYNIEFFQKEAGAYRIRLQDNSVKGRTVDVGHITAVVSGDTATISSKIANEYQGNKLSYALYSEMAERLRAMGIRRVDGQIVNKDGVPIRVRERIIGDTRDYFSGKPIDQIEGARRIREKQEIVGDMGGVDVYNELYPNARYMLAEGEMEGGRTYTPEQMKGTFIGRYADNNDRLVRNLDVDYELFSSGDQGRLLIKKLDGTEISAVTFDIVGKEAIVSFSSVSGKYQGKGIGNLAYSELIERFRSMGIKEVTGMIIDDKDRPLKIRKRIIDQENARVGGRPTDITGTRYDQDGSKQMDVVSHLEPKAWYMPAEGDRLIQNGFEKSDLNEKLLKSGHIVLGFDERELAGKAVVINNPDTMMTGELKTKEGKTLVEGEGGLNFVSKFADIWANSVESKAKTTASKLRKAQEENGGIAYLALTRGELTKALNSHTGAKAGMSILEHFVDQGYISLEEFRNALKDSGRKYGIEFNATQSAKAIHAEIAQKFFGVSDSSFKARGNFVTDIITHLAKKGESGHKNIEKIRTALGSERLGREIDFAQTGIREAIGLMISDKRANVDPSHIYAYIEVTGKISVEKTENGHKSYPYHIVQRDAEGNKIRPRMLLPDKTNYVTDVMLDSNKEEVPRTYQVTSKEGKLQTKSGSGKLGSNQVGEAYGYVKSADKIPEGKERLKWMPAEGWRDWQSERTSVGSVIKNTAGYLIMVQRDKFKVYNPYKAMIGIYDNEEQAKRRVQKDEPRR